MAALAVDRDPETSRRSDVRDETKGNILLLEYRTLFDMQLNKSRIRPAGEPHAFQRPRKTSPLPDYIQRFSIGVD